MMFFPQITSSDLSLNRVELIGTCTFNRIRSNSYSSLLSLIITATKEKR